MMITTIEPQTKPYKKLENLNDKEHRSIVRLCEHLPKNHDIRSIRLETVPKNLQKVCLFIGGQPIATMYDLVENANLLEEFMYDKNENLPISKSNNYLEAWLVFYFNKNLTDVDPSTYTEHFHTIEKYENLDEYDSHDEDNFYDNKVVTVYDEDEDRYVTGRVVVSKLTTVMRIYFHTPRIFIETVENTEYIANIHNKKIPHTYVKIWENLTIMKHRHTEETIKKYICNYETNIDGETLLKKYQYLIDNNEPFTIKIVNILRFTGGMAGLSYRF